MVQTNFGNKQTPTSVATAATTTREKAVGFTKGIYRVGGVRGEFFDPS